MSPGEPTRFPGRCKALYLGTKPQTVRDLQPLLLRHFPLCAAVELPLYRSHQELAVAFRSAVPKICFVEVERSPEAVLNLIPELLKVDAKLGIIAILPQNQPDLILRCLRLGATDFLIQPVTPDQVESAAQKLVKTLPRPEASTAPAKIYCVMPAKGACGATTLACNLAFYWKQNSRRVLLADLDPLTGTISFLLKLKATSSFVDVVMRADDIDSDLWKAMVTSVNGIDVLPSPESPSEGALEFTDASSIIDFARYNYDFVVADTASVFGDWNISQAQLSDEVLLVATNELSSLHAAQKALSYLETKGVGRWKIKLIINRYDAEVGLSQEHIANALHTDVFQMLPSDHQAVHKSLMDGKPVPATSNFGKAVALLADRLTGREQPTKKNSSLSGLLSFFSRSRAES